MGYLTVSHQSKHNSRSLPN